MTSSMSPGMDMALYPPILEKKRPRDGGGCVAASAWHLAKILLLSVGGGIIGGLGAIDADRRLALGKQRSLLGGSFLRVGKRS